MPPLDRSLQAQVKRILGNPDLFPDEFKAWVPKQVQDNASIKLQPYQIPKLAQGPYVGTMAAGPPSAPVHNQLWIATDVNGTSTCWKFRYNANSASGFKWEFIGGPPDVSEIDTNETTVSLTYVDLATAGPSLTVARAGDYLALISGQAANNTAGDQGHVGIKIGAAATADAIAGGSGVANIHGPTTIELKITCAAGDVVKLQYKAVTGGTATFLRRVLALTPGRIS